MQCSHGFMCLGCTRRTTVATKQDVYRAYGCSTVVSSTYGNIKPWSLYAIIIKLYTDTQIIGPSVRQRSKPCKSLTGPATTLTAVSVLPP